MKSMDHLIAHMDRPYRDWMTRKDWVERRLVDWSTSPEMPGERASDTDLGQSGDVELVQLAHMITNSTKISCHVQGNNEAIEGSLDP